MDIIGQYTPWEPPSENISGTQCWYKNDKIHRDTGPAVIYADGSKFWYKDGKFHRECGPAIMYADQSKECWVNGKLHCDDSPAVIYSCGYKEWFKDGQEITVPLEKLAKECKIDLDDTSETNRMILKILINGL